MACNPKTQAFIVDRDAIDPDEGIQELALFYPNGLPISFGTIASEIDLEVVAARDTFATLGARLDALGDSVETVEEVVDARGSYPTLGARLYDFADGLTGEKGDKGDPGRGFAVIDSNEDYTDVPAENVTGDIIFRRFA